MVSLARPEISSRKVNLKGLPSALTLCYISVDGGKRVILEIPYLAHIPFCNTSQVSTLYSEKIQEPTDVVEPDNQVQTNR